MRYALLIAASFVVSSPANAWTEAQCRTIAEKVTLSLNVLPKKNWKLSPEFKSSLKDFMFKDNQLTCDGPATLYINTAIDRGVIMTIDEDLKKVGIGLASGGVKFVVAPLTPETKKVP